MTVKRKLWSSCSFSEGLVVVTVAPESQIVRHLQLTPRPTLRVAKQWGEGMRCGRAPSSV